MINKPFINEEISKVVTPIFNYTEIEIKKIIKHYIDNGLSEEVMRKKIMVLINKAIRHLKLPNIEDFRWGFINSARRWIHEYKVANIQLRLMGSEILYLVGKSLPKNATTAQIIKEVKSIPRSSYRKIEYMISSKYESMVINRTKILAQSPIQITDASGKGKMNAFARAELEVRHEEQMRVVNEIKSKGIVLQRLSAHGGCSKRCEPWQGKLVDMNAPPVDKSMWTGKKHDGEKIYSFVGITSQIDKYGYTNNIIVGFNCRHTLLDPNLIEIQYTKEEIEKDRKINDDMRRRERAIINNKKEYALTGNKEYLAKARALTKDYKEYANENKIAWYEWRINLSNRFPSGVE